MSSVLILLPRQSVRCSLPAHRPLVEAVNPGSDDLILLPNFAGTTQPDDNPAARGVFLGVSLATGRSHFARAIFEGVAFMLRENLELVEQVSGTTVHEIHSLGGGAKSKTVADQADVNEADHHHG